MAQWQLGNHEEALQLDERVAAVVDSPSGDTETLSRLLTEAALPMGLPGE